IGSDAYSTVQAQSPATPWKTIGRALHTVTSGHTIRIKPGTYPENLEAKFADVRIRADGPAGTIVVAPATGVGLAVTAHDVVVEGLVFRGSSQGIRAENADGIVVRGCTAVGQSTTGFAFIATTGLTIENSTAVSAGSRGFHVDHDSSSAYLRNNLVYDNGEWGIDVDNTVAGGGQPALSTGNVVAFNTVALNGGGAGQGGVRLRNAIGEVRDNVIADNANVGLRIDTPGASVHHNLISGSAAALSPDSYVVGTGMIEADPLFVDPDGADGVLGGVSGYADDRFAIGQIAAGQSADSPARNAGSGTVASRDIGGSTRSDGVSDSSTADMGFHSNAPASTGVPPPITTGPATYYVGPTGSDSRSKVAAQSPATPWRTIGKALASVVSGETIVVAAGTYPESSLETTVAGITLRADGDAVIAPPANPTPTVGLVVSQPNVLVDGFRFTGALHGVRATAADGLVVRRCRIESPTGNGIWVTGTTGAVVDSNEIADAGGRGIYVQNSTLAYVRNNLVTGAADWGIQVDTGIPPPAASTDNVVSFNTVVDCGTTQGGIAFNNASGEIRDNVLAGNVNRGIRVDTDPTLIHHNDVFGSATPIDVFAGAPTMWANLFVDPLFVDAGNGNYALRSADLEGADSPAIDRASGSPGARDISGSTRSDGGADAGTADLGHHANAAPSTTAPAMSEPPSTGGPSVFHVDGASGDDTRTSLDALDSSTPWKTIGRALAALDGAQAGDTVVVAAGTYAESVQLPGPGIALQASGQATLNAPPASPAVATDFADTAIEGFTIVGGTHGVRADHADRLSVRGCTFSGQSSNGILTSDSNDVVIDSNRVSGAPVEGITVKGSAGSYVRNNLVRGSGEWGIHIDNGDPPAPPAIDGHVVAFNTVYGNGLTSGTAGGIRFQNATGEIRDNVVA